MEQDIVNSIPSELTLGRREFFVTPILIAGMYAKAVQPMTPIDYAKDLNVPVLGLYAG